MTTITNLQTNHIVLQFPDLYEGYQRLKGVGGFISMLGTDPRVSLFCRYDHVQRVIKLTGILVNILGIEKSQRIMFLAHFHDINRLPLTYVMEKALGYNQNENIRPYLSGYEDDIPEDYVCALEAMMSKRTDHSFDVRFVYLSDMVVNFVEDLLFAIVLLDLSPGCLPNDVLSAIGFDRNETEFRDDVECLKQYFSSDEGMFSEYFHRASLKYMLRFIERLGGAPMFLSDIPLDKSMAALTVKRFLVKTIFPVVDEKIVKETALVQKVVLPYYNSLKKANMKPYERLWNMTDGSFLDSAVEMGLIKDESIKEFWPVLDSSKTRLSKKSDRIEECVSL